MAPKQMLLLLLSLCLIQSTLSQSNPCGDITIFCQTPNNPSCCVGKCCEFLNIYKDSSAWPPINPELITVSPPVTNAPRLIQSASPIASSVPLTLCNQGYLNCLVPPCIQSSCEAYPTAICTNYECGGCIPIWTDWNGNVLTEEECAASEASTLPEMDYIHPEMSLQTHGVSVILSDVMSQCSEGYVVCDHLPCDYVSCPAYPSAICTNNFCGGCNAIFSLLHNNGVVLTELQCRGANIPPVIQPAIILPSILVVESRTITGCSVGYVNCITRPCSIKTCPAHPTATCTDDYCGGCNAVFSDENGDILTVKHCEIEITPSDPLCIERFALCDPTPCSISQCASHADAICTNNFCGECSAIWKDGNGEELSAQQCAVVQVLPPVSQPNPETFPQIDIKPEVEPLPTVAQIDAIPEVEPCSIGYIACGVTPCSIASCRAYPTATCTNDYCGGCHALFKDEYGIQLSAAQCNVVLPIFVPQIQTTTTTTTAAPVTTTTTTTVPPTTTTTTVPPTTTTIRPTTATSAPTTATAAPTTTKTTTTAPPTTTTLRPTIATSAPTTATSAPTTATSAPITTTTTTTVPPTTTTLRPTTATSAPSTATSAPTATTSAPTTTTTTTTVPPTTTTLRPTAATSAPSTATSAPTAATSAPTTTITTTTSTTTTTVRPVIVVQPEPAHIVSLCSLGYVVCDPTPCLSARCPAYPTATCTTDNCGGCSAIFKDENGIQLSSIQCNDVQTDPPIVKTSTLRPEYIQLPNDVPLPVVEANPIPDVLPPHIIPNVLNIALAPKSQASPETTTKAASTLVSDILNGQCSNIGEKCSSAVSESDRCCVHSGVAECLFDVGVFDGAYEIGRCCIKHRKKGCVLDSDCCRVDGVCTKDGKCKKDRSGLIAAAARDVDSKFDNFEMVNDEEGTNYMTISISTVTMIFIVVLLAIPSGCYWYYRKCILKKIKQEVRREVFHGLEVSAHSDNEFDDSDENGYID